MIQACFKNHLGEASQRRGSTSVSVPCEPAAENVGTLRDLGHSEERKRGMRRGERGEQCRRGGRCSLRFSSDLQSTDLSNAQAGREISTMSASDFSQ